MRSCSRAMASVCVRVPVQQQLITYLSSSTETSACSTFFNFSTSSSSVASFSATMSLRFVSFRFDR